MDFCRKASKALRDEKRQKPGVEAHAYNPSYLKNGDLENLGSRPAQANSETPISINKNVGCGGTCLPS
jgi:hypothetical protein